MKSFGWKARFSVHRKQARDQPKQKEGLSMEPPLPPCPECRGQRAFFQCFSTEMYVSFWRRIKLYGHTCLECGYTTLRVHPDDLKILQKATDKAQGKVFHPCPECGGERVFLRRIISLARGGERSLLPWGAFKGVVSLVPCTCLACGYTTERPHPRDLKELREAAERSKTVESSLIHSDDLSE